jgi:vacuolar-type H+-ATPase subunit H
MDLDRAKSTNAGSGIVQDPNRLNPQVEAKTQPQAASDIVTESTEAASDIIRDVKNVSGEIIEHAKTAADGVIDQVQQAASEALTSSLQDLGTQAQEMARNASEHAAAAAENLYQHGSEYVSRKTRNFPISAVLIAGALGYGIGYLSSRR